MTRKNPRGSIGEQTRGGFQSVRSVLTVLPNTKEELKEFLAEADRAREKRESLRRSGRGGGLTRGQQIRLSIARTRLRARGKGKLPHKRIPIEGEDSLREKLANKIRAAILKFLGFKKGGK